MTKKSRASFRNAARLAELQVLRLRPPMKLADFAQDDNFVGGGMTTKKSRATLRDAARLAEMQVLRLRPPMKLADFVHDDNFVGGGMTTKKSRATFRDAARLAEMQVLRLRPPMKLADFAQDDNFVGGERQRKAVPHLGTRRDWQRCRSFDCVRRRSWRTSLRMTILLRGNDDKEKPCHI